MLKQHTETQGERLLSLMPSLILSRTLLCSNATPLPICSFQRHRHNGPNINQQYDLMEDDGVLVLGAHNFDAVTERFMLILVLLYKPGCDGCADLIEEYVEASDDLYEHLIPAGKVGSGGGGYSNVVF